MSVVNVCDCCGEEWCHEYGSLADGIPNRLQGSVPREDPFDDLERRPREPYTVRTHTIRRLLKDELKSGEFPDCTFRRNVVVSLGRTQSTLEGIRSLGDIQLCSGCAEEYLKSCANVLKGMMVTHDQ